MISLFGGIPQSASSTVSVAEAGSVRCLLIQETLPVCQLLLFGTLKGPIPGKRWLIDTFLNRLLADATDPDFSIEASIHLQKAGMAPASIGVLLLGHETIIILGLCTNVHRRKPVKTHQRIKGRYFLTLDALSNQNYTDILCYRPIPVITEN